jgi:ABC-type proline/glycine betaine transport system ATPase subunit
VDATVPSAPTAALAFGPSHDAPADSGPTAVSAALRPAVQLVSVSKRYHPSAPPALDHVTLDVWEGELLFLLGPSGSGKTTALRLIAGYETPDSGSVVLGGMVANALPAHRRNVGMVFQSYALFPHMTVAQNVAFGLRMRGAPRAARDERTSWALDLVRLPGLAWRYPAELSGGQQQRVALARALAFGPTLLLLDEPFANLDRHLREEMRVEFRALQRRLGLTTIFVTHDQEEALGLADRVAVLDQGRLVRAGAPLPSGAGYPPAWPGRIDRVDVAGPRAVYVVGLDAGPEVRVPEPAADGAPRWPAGAAVAVTTTGAAACLLCPAGEGAARPAAAPFAPGGAGS